MLGEQIEALSPSACVSVARLNRIEAGLLQRDFCLASQSLEPDRHDGFRPGPAALVVPRMGHDNALVRNDLAIDAAEPKLLAVGRAHAAAPLSTGAKIAFRMGDREAARCAPFADVLAL